MILLSVPLFLEYEAVLTRDEHLSASGLTRTEALKVLDTTALVGAQMRRHFSWRPTIRDPDDEMVVETTVNGRADALVTFNLRDYSVGMSAFGIAVVRPGDALRRFL